MTAITPFKFKNKEVRTIIDEHGEALFVGKDVCDNLGYADATTAIRSHCRGVQKLHPIADSMGRMRDTRVLTEADVLRLVVNSTLPAAEEFERWVFEEVLPSIRKTGSYTAPQAQQGTGEELELKLLNMAADFLRVSPSGRLQMIGGFMRLRAPAMAPLLPAYAIDAPAGAGGSSEPTMSATELLKRHNINMSAAKFNTLLNGHGLIEKQRRPSTGGLNKEFWSVTEEGQAFGKNVTSDKNPRETQPHWYVAKFAELLKTVEQLAA
jgi:prophage antirepressor-like protein